MDKGMQIFVLCYNDKKQTKKISCCGTIITYCNNV